jgi:hypothetical protein
MYVGGPVRNSLDYLIDGPYSGYMPALGCPVGLDSDADGAAAGYGVLQLGDDGDVADGDAAAGEGAGTVRQMQQQNSFQDNNHMSWFV